MIKVFVNYPVCKANLAPYWKLDELNITVENLHEITENIQHEIYLDEQGLCIKVFSQDDAKQMIASTKDRYDRFNHDVKITQDYLKQYASDSCINTDEESASKIFAGAIAYASTVFINRLALGGAYRNTKNCKEIIECLKQLNDLVK